MSPCEEEWKMQYTLDMDIHSYVIGQHHDPAGNP